MLNLLEFWIFYENFFLPVRFVDQINCFRGFEPVEIAADAFCISAHEIKSDPVPDFQQRHLDLGPNAIRGIAGRTPNPTDEFFCFERLKIFFWFCFLNFNKFQISIFKLFERKFLVDEYHKPERN